MTDRIRIFFTPAEGALIRILGTIERRGYVLHAVEARTGESGGELSLELAARDPGRRLDVLAAQLRRLHDVTDVTPFPVIQPVTQSAA